MGFLKTDAAGHAHMRRRYAAAGVAIVLVSLTPACGDFLDTSGILPNVVGMKAGDAEDAIEEAGWPTEEVHVENTKGSVVFNPNDDWLVDRQEPGAGKYDTTEKVTLFVHKVADDEPETKKVDESGYLAALEVSGYKTIYANLGVESRTSKLQRGYEICETEKSGASETEVLGEWLDRLGASTQNEAKAVAFMVAAARDQLCG